MMLAVTAVAIGVFMWLRYVTPNVAGISLTDGEVVLHMTDEFVQRRLTNDHITRSAGGGYPSFDGSYVLFPIHLSVIVAVVLCVLGGGYLGITAFVRRPTMRGGKVPSASPLR